MKLSVLIPAFDEERTVEALLYRALAAETPGWEREIILVDDASRDATAKIAEGVEGITVLKHPVNRGKGAAVRTALDAATGDYCLVQDADLEYDPDDWAAMLDRAEAGAVAVYGSRFLNDRWPASMRRRYWLFNRGYSALANVLSGSALSDHMTCYKLVRTDVMRQLGLRAERFDICAELTGKLLQQGVDIEEVPIRYVARDASAKKIGVKDAVRHVGAAWVHRPR